MSAASIIGALAISGSRKSDGTANASGLVYAYLPNTTTRAPLYSDPACSAQVTQPLTLDSGGRINRSDYPDGVFCAVPIRLLIQDSDGATVSDLLYTPASASTTAVDNAFFSSAITTADEGYTAALTSFGGQDWKVKVSSGATDRKVKDKFVEVFVSVKDFGAVGNGNAIDTTAIQAAMSFAKSLANTSTGLGSVTVLFPAGSYKIDQALVLSSARVNLRGESSGATQILTTSTSARVFSLTTCSTFAISGMSIRCSADNSASAIYLTDCSDVSVEDVRIDSNNGAGTFLVTMAMTTSAGNSSGILFDRVALTGRDAAGGRCVLATNTTLLTVRASVMLPQGGVAMEFAGSTSNVNVTSTYFSGTGKAALWTSGMTGTNFVFSGNPSIGDASFTTFFDLSNLSTDPDFRQWGNGVDGYTENLTSGSTFTPTRSKGRQIRVSGTTTGSAYTVAAPTPAPSSSMRDVTLVIQFYNNAGGAITGWTMNAVYHLSAGPSTTDGQITTYILGWDADASVWREQSRTVTT